MPFNGYFTPMEIEKIDNAVSHIHQHYQKDLSIEQLASEIGIDTKNLQIGIQLRTGFTVHNYLLKVRIENAIPDLEDFGRSIKFIAHKHGFSSHSHFGSEFKKQLGMTPKEYRKKLIEERAIWRAFSHSHGKQFQFK